MDNKQFIVELVRATIWPLLIFFMVRSFSSELKALLGRVQKLNFRTGEIAFNEALERVRGSAEAILGKPSSVDMSYSKREKDELEKYQNLASMEPAAAVMIAWKGLERYLRARYRDARLANSKIGSPTAEMIKQLVEADIIDAQYAAVLNELWKLRNIATHAEDHQISAEKALDYARLCLSLSESLRSQPD